MQSLLSSRNKSAILPLMLFVTILFTLSGLMAQTPFTTDDALRLKSLRIQAVTDDGRYVAATAGTRRGRLNVDHKQFGDPTYIAPRVVEVLIVDTETGRIQKPFRGEVQVRSFSWSPDGKMLAFFLLKNGKYTLQLFDPVNGKLRQVNPKTSRAISSSSPLEWYSDGSSLFIGLREDGWAEQSKAMFKEATVGPIVVYDASNPLLKWEEIRERSALQVIARVHIQNRRIEELLPEGRYRDIRLSKDNAWLLYLPYKPIKTDYSRKGGTEYVLNALSLKDSSLSMTLIDKTEKRLRLSWNDENTVFAWADSGHIFMQAIDDTAGINLTRGKIQNTDDDSSKVKFSMERFSPDGSVILTKSKKGYWIVDPQAESVQMVYEFPEEEEDRPRLNVQGWSNDGRYLYLSYSAKKKWERGMVQFDLEEKKMSALVKDTGLYTNWHVSKSGERFVYQFSDGNLPSEIFSATDLSTPKKLTDSNSWLTDKKITRTELVQYLDVDGNELNGILYYPVDYDPNKKYPLVCEIYETFFNNGFHTNMNLVANQGYFGFRPSVKLNEGYPGEAWMKGITTGINKLIDRGLVDPKKLGVHGTSYGGYAASLLITQTDRFAAAINISGKTNIISFLGDSPRIGTRNYAAAEVGQDRIGASLWDAPLKYLQHTAILYADRVKTPHLLLTGQDDWNVPMASTREMYYALRRLGKECIWVDYVNAGHGAGRAGNEAQFHDMWKRMFDFYKVQFEKADKKSDKDKKNG